MMQLCHLFNCLNVAYSQESYLTQALLTYLITYLNSILPVVFIH